MNKEELLNNIISRFLDDSPESQAKSIKTLIGKNLESQARQCVLLLLRKNKIKFIQYMSWNRWLYKFLYNANDELLTTIKEERFSTGLFQEMINLDMTGNFLEFVSKEMDRKAFEDKIKCFDKSFEQWEHMLALLTDTDMTVAEHNIIDTEDMMEKKHLEQKFSWLCNYLERIDPIERLKFYRRISTSQLKKCLWIGAYHYNYVKDYIAMDGDSSLVLFGYKFGADGANDEETKKEYQKWVLTFVKIFSKAPIYKIILMFDFLSSFFGEFDVILFQLIPALPPQKLEILLRKRKIAKKYLSVAQIVSSKSKVDTKEIGALVESTGDEGNIPKNLEDRINGLPPTERLLLAL